MSTAVKVMGQFQVERNGVVRSLPPAAQRLVALLALDSAAHSRELVAGTLWPDSSRRAAAASLRTVLWRVNADLPGLVDGGGDTLALTEATHVDARTMVDAVWRLLAANDHEGPVANDLPSRDLSHQLQSTLLEGWYDDWVLAERERMRQLRLHGLEALARHWGANARFGDAIDAALAAVRCEELRESAHRVVIELHIAEGNISEAVRHYAHFATQLRANLNIDPSPHMVSLMQSINSAPCPPTPIEKTVVFD